MNKIIFIILLSLATACYSQKNHNSNNEVKAPIKISSWKKIPVVSGRVANEKDLQDGVAVFYLNNDKNHDYYEIELPKLAYLYSEESDSTNLIVLIQAESSSNGVIIGYKDFNGEIGACFLEELKFLTNSEIEKIESKK